MSTSLLLITFFIILLHQSLFCFAGNKPQPFSQVINPKPFSQVINPKPFSHLFDENQPLDSVPKLLKWLFSFGAINTIATLIIIQLIIINIVVYKLRELHELKFNEKFDGISLLALKNTCRQFSIGEILLATNNFDDSLVIGRGGFGKVYKGKIDNGGTNAAIKRLGFMSKQGATEFRAEITMLSRFRHSNIVSLIGYCEAYNEMILVFEYIEHGTIADHLYKIREKGGNHVHLRWIQRLKICIGAARGLDYLHSGTGIKERVIHRDVKTSNILLDENWAARIADFGLSKVGPANRSFTHVSTNVKGTLGYMDPEYFYTHRLTRKSDVYAFGVVLFEVLCGRPAVDVRLDESQRILARWARDCVREGMYESIVDPRVKWEIFSESLSAFVKIAENCLRESSKERPTMSEVVAEIEFSLTEQERRSDSLAEEDIFGDEIPESSTKEKTVTATEVLVTKVDPGEKKLVGATDAGRMNIKTLLVVVLVWWITPFAPRDRKSDPGRSKNSGKSIFGHKDEVVPQNGQIVNAKLKIFSFAELKIATSNFRANTVLGEGRFGKVHKGWVHEKTLEPTKPNVGFPVAIKKFNLDRLQVLKEWQAQLNFLGECIHPYLVQFLGYCYKKKNMELLLVYEFVSKGSLENYIFRRDKELLSWTTRLKIATGAAKGLAFLHSLEKKVIFCDFSSSNILLDDDFNPKVSDFELGKPGWAVELSHVTTRVMGKYGCTAPEFIDTGHLYVNSDVYSFGVVLLEMLTGLRAFDVNRPTGEHNLIEYAVPLLVNKRKLTKLLDPSLELNYPLDNAFVLAKLIGRCLKAEPKDRPSMIEVVEILEQLLQK